MAAAGVGPGRIWLLTRNQSWIGRADLDRLVWHENLDGAGSFGPRQSLPTDSNYTRAVVAADFDGDSDLDVLSATDALLSSQGVAWRENLRDDCNDNGLPDVCEKGSLTGLRYTLPRSWSLR